MRLFPIFVEYVIKAPSLLDVPPLGSSWLFNFVFSLTHYMREGKHLTTAPIKERICILVATGSGWGEWILLCGSALLTDLAHPGESR
ncbi:hypothetical protein NPIL_59851 [Nephila pilipes]|uniref:Uncharacterized protein n=1 Tax=Nephila pilipes TaxID=299642 RepID=A0A8X6Q4N5_NEPPI|nr:hypothetical protein NPIL_59851 [Nephila pilipes]